MASDPKASREASPYEQTAMGPEGPEALEVASTAVGAFDATQALSPGQAPHWQPVQGVPSPPPGPRVSTQPAPIAEPARPTIGASTSAPDSVADTSFLRPFGPFTAVEPLSEQGAMGLVAKGYNGAFDRWELLKFLRSIHAQNPELVRQFQREGRVLAKLSHPNVVQVFAIYSLDGRPCLAMEFLEGETLAAHAAAQGQKMAVGRWYELFLSAARGLAAAHEVGLLHRDLKPENLFVLSGRKGGVGGLKLIDFGLATADKSRRDVTHDPALVAATSGGTPLYMAPELWRRADATPRSDLFALGMTFFVALTGKFPYEIGKTLGEVAMAVCEDRPFPDARDLRPDLPAPLSAVLKRLLAKAPGERFEGADELVAALVAASSEAKERRVPGSGPYRGLSSFSAAERDVFFGRESEVVEVLERLRGQGGLVLVGPSGSGKSSLAHAGVVPAVEEGALGGGIVYRATRLEPRAHPAQSLAAALARVVPTPEKELLQFLRSTPERLGEALRQALPPGVGALVVIDQLEETATLAQDSAEVRDFSRAIESLTGILVPELRVLATLRADLMDRLFTIEPLRHLLTKGFYPVRPLLGDGLRRALLGPAQAAGYGFEDPAVIDAILADVARSPAGLPLMSFAMASWWQARDEVRKVLPTAAWRDLGGVAGALSRHGDGVLASMSREDRAAAEQILLRLVSADGTRARASRATLIDPAAAGPGAGRALDHMVNAKLLLESGGEIELVHEALISQWPALRQLLASAGEDRAFRERVASVAREWDAQGRPDGALWSDEQAERLLRWFAATPSSLDQGELAFIEAVRNRVARRRFALRAGVFASLAIAVTFALVTKKTEHELQGQYAEASRRATQLEAEFRRAEGGRLRALAERQLQEDPAHALTTALESYEKAPHPALDVIAWRARFRGLPAPLPLHRKGALFASFSRKGEWIASGGADGSVAVLAAKGPGTASMHPSRDDGALPRAMVFADDTLVIGSSIGEIVTARAPKFSPQVIGRCQGAAEFVVWLGDSALARCADRKLLKINPTDRRVDELASDASWLTASRNGAAAAFVRSGGKLALVSPQGTAEVAPPGREIDAVALAEDASRMLIVERDGTTQWAPLVDGKPQKFAAHSEKIAPPALNLGVGPDGAHLAIGADRRARLWLRDGRSISVESSGAFTWVPAKHLLLLADRDNDVLALSTISGETIGRLQGAIGAISTVHANTEGTWAVVASADGATRAYDLDQSTWQLTPPAAAASGVCAVASDGAAIGCADGSRLTIGPVRGSAGGLKEGRTEAVERAPTLLALGPRGERASWAAPGHWVVQGKALAGPASPAALAMSGRHAALAGKAADGAGFLQIAPTDGGAPVNVATAEHPLALAFARDEGRVAAATAEGNVLLINPTSGAIERTIALAAARLEGDPSALAFSDDEASLFVGSRAGVLAVAPLGGKPPLRLARLSAPALCAAWSQSGRGVAVTLADGYRHFIDVDTSIGFSLGQSASPAVSCARSPIDDRFSFALASGMALVRMVDATPLTMSRAIDPALDPRTMPLASWPGLPKVWH